MKKILVKSLIAILILFSAVLNVCGDLVSAKNRDSTNIPAQSATSLADLPEVGGSFNISESRDENGNTILKLTPSYAGVAGDGFIVQYYGDYFIAEGQDIVLQNDQNYRLTIIRVFLTDRGFVFSKNYKSYNINTDKPEIYTNTLPFAKPSSPYFGWLLPPIITANFKNNSVSVTPYFSYNPIIACDELEILFGGGSARAHYGRQPISRYAAPLYRGNEFRLPAENYYSGVWATSRVIDLTHGRVLVSPFSYLGFIQ
jgi:hypothetical protein